MIIVNVRKNDVCGAIARMQNNDDSGLYNTFIMYTYIMVLRLAKSAQFDFE